MNMFTDETTEAINNMLSAKNDNIDHANFSSAFWDAQHSRTNLKKTENYLDLKTGDVLFLSQLPDVESDVVSDEDRELIEQWNQVTKYPKRFIKICPNDGPYCLEEFVQSDWTDDADEKSIAASAYYNNKGPGLYTKFKDEVSEATLRAFDDFQETVKDREMETWLASLGIKAKWIR